MSKYSREMIASRTPRVRSWILGYYTALQEQNRGLIDIKFEDLDYYYKRELQKRADKQTEQFVRRKTAKYIQVKASVACVDNCKKKTSQGI